MRVLLLVFLAGPAQATTTFGSLSNQSVVGSTSGVIGSVSLGNTQNKTAVWVSSTQGQAAIATMFLSSYTVPAGKTFYLQHMDAWAYESVPSTSVTVNMGSVQWSNPNGTVVSSMAFMNQMEPSPRWVIEFAEPVPMTAGTTLLATFKANVATAITAVTNLAGYIK